MGKKKKFKENAPRAAVAAAAPVPVKAEESKPLSPMIKDLFRHPMLLLAWISLGLTVFAVGAAIRFRDNPDMGAIREPTSIILWAAITATFFASYCREIRRTTKSGS